MTAGRCSQTPLQLRSHSMAIEFRQFLNDSRAVSADIGAEPRSQNPIFDLRSQINCARLIQPFNVLRSLRTVARICALSIVRVRAPFSIPPRGYSVCNCTGPENLASLSMAKYAGKFTMPSPKGHQRG